jgi:hypothetical protein
LSVGCNLAELDNRLALVLGVRGLSHFRFCRPKIEINPFPMICIRSGWTSWKRWSFSNWRALTRYVDDGLLEINKSAAERALRAV